MLDWHMDDKFRMVNPEQEQSIPKKHIQSYFFPE
jgi:hypothetical protein